MLLKGGAHLALDNWKEIQAVVTRQTHDQGTLSARPLSLADGAVRIALGDRSGPVRFSVDIHTHEVGIARQVRPPCLRLRVGLSDAILDWECRGTDRELLHMADIRSS